MKTNVTYFLGRLGLAVGLMVGPFTHAFNPAAISKDLAGASVLEMPAKAAALVSQAKLPEKQDVTAAVVKAALGLNPSASVAIVAAISRENPSSASIAAVTAATLDHKRIALIAKAAANAAPTMATQIVDALIKEFPQDYGTIAVAASEGAPDSGGAILAIVADYVPALQAPIKQATAAFSSSGGNVPVQAVLSQSYSQAVESGSAVTYQSSGSSAAIAAGGNAYSAQNAQVPLSAYSSAGGATILARTSVPLSLTSPQRAYVPSVSSPTLGPPYQPVPPTVNNYGPSSLTPQQGTTYSSPSP